MNRIKAISYEDRVSIFWTVAGVAIFSLFIYFYAVGAIARNTALRENLEAHLADAGSRIGELEFAKIKLENAVTAEVARQYGFKEVRAPLFVTRVDRSALTYNR